MPTLTDALLDLFNAIPALWLGTIFVLGLLVGSFLNVVIHRLPIMLERAWKAEAEAIIKGDTDTLAAPEPPGPRYNLVVPRSACPKCGALITAAQNVPVISYLLLRGKCAKCANPISIRYPLVELLTGILSALVAWKFGVHWYTAAALFLTWMLIAMSWIDYDTKLLPDNLTLTLLWVGLLLSVIGTDRAVGLPVDMRSSLLGAAAGYLSLWFVYHAFKFLTNKEGMAFGDFKLFGALGAWLGYQSLLPIILLSSLAGSILGGILMLRGRHRDNPIPFGPYLAIAGWIALMWGNELLAAYWRFSGIRH